MVRPPPGVSSGLERSAHGLGQAAGEGQAEPDAGGVVGVAEALEGQEDPVPVVGRDAGAAVDDADLDPVAEPAAGQVGRLSGRRVAQGVGAEVRQDPFQQSGVGLDEGELLGRVDEDASARPRRGRRGLARRPRPRRSAARRSTWRRPAGGSCRAGCRRGPASRSREVSAAWSSSRRSSGARSRSRLSRVETDALAAASGVRKSCPTAASSAVRTLLASASGAASAAAWLSRMWSSTTAAWAANAPIRRWSSAWSRPPRRARTSRSPAGTSVSASLGRATAGPGARDRRPAVVVALQQRDRGEAEGLADPLAASPSAPPRRPARCRRGWPGCATRRPRGPPAGCVAPRGRPSS